MFYFCFSFTTVLLLYYFTYVLWTFSVWNKTWLIDWLICLFLSFLVFTRDSCTGRYCRERVLAKGILSVSLSVTTRYAFKARWDRDSGSSPYDSLESLVSSEVIWCRWVKRFFSNEGIKEGHPLRSRYCTTIDSSSVKTVADRHILAA